MRLEIGQNWPRFPTRFACESPKSDRLLGIDNLFDKRYLDHPYDLNTRPGVAEKGRNVKVTFIYWF